MTPLALLRPTPTFVLFLGLGMLLLAVIGTFTGKIWGRGSPDRAKEPSAYWGTLIFQYLLAALSIWIWYVSPR